MQWHALSRAFSGSLWLRTPALWVSAALVLALILDAGTTLHRLSLENRSPPAPGMTVFGRRLAHRAGGASIIAAHLFGRSQESVGDTRVAAGKSLVLTGTVATGDPREGAAIIGPSAETARLIRAGSVVVPGTMLAEVYPLRVVVDQHGVRTAIPLPRWGSAQNGAGQMDGEGHLVRTASRPEDVAGSGESDTPPAPETPPPLPDAGAVLRALNLRPSDRGMRVMGTAFNSGALAALGLQPGDVIVQVDGSEVAGRSASADLMHAIQEGQATTLTVSRGGNFIGVVMNAQSTADAADAYRAITQPQ
jgi:type II secretory pathway component PulC